MPTLILRPNANGLANVMNPIGDAPNYKCVDDVIADDDATYVETPNGCIQVASNEELYHIQNHTTETGTINSIKVYCKVYHYDPMFFGDLMECGLSIFQATVRVFDVDVSTVGSNNWVVVSHIWSQNPWTSTTWTWNNIDDLQIGFYHTMITDAPNETVRITQMYIEVDYELPPPPPPPTVKIGSHKSSQESVYQHKSSQENIYEFKTVT